jgi:ectoine hydroxylase-related dioxygenase (phytanoyl-CoA dioxygenase family)
MCPFKEKINHKLAGSGGFAPHIDATAYTHVKDIKHLTILLAVDETNMNNGGLEVVDGSHVMTVPVSKADNCIEARRVVEQQWTPVELAAGELPVVGSHQAHRSGANMGSKNCKATYAAYNRKREGELYDGDYKDRAQEWPATHMRKEGEKYEKRNLC